MHDDPEWVKIRLVEELAKPLPGLKAQLRMAPKGRLASKYLQPMHGNARHSSVLILLYPDERKRLHFPLILRTEYDGAHSGQVALPGGKREESDADNRFTALREAQEELGIDPAQVEILGELTELYVWASNYMVYPVVGYSSVRPHFVANAEEVAGFIETNLARLLHKPEIRTMDMDFNEGLRIQAPYYPVAGKVVWGATAMILGELLEVAERILPYRGVTKKGNDA